MRRRLAQEEQQRGAGGGESSASSRTGSLGSGDESSGGSSSGAQRSSRKNSMGLRAAVLGTTNSGTRSVSAGSSNNNSNCNSDNSLDDCDVLCSSSSPSSPSSPFAASGLFQRRHAHHLRANMADLLPAISRTPLHTAAANNNTAGTRKHSLTGLFKRKTSISDSAITAPLNAADVFHLPVMPKSTATRSSSGAVTEQKLLDVDAASKFLGAVLDDPTLDDDTEQRLALAILLLHLRNGTLMRLVESLCTTEWNGDPLCWRARTPLMLLYHSCVLTGESHALLESTCFPLLQLISRSQSKAATPEQVVQAVTDLIESFSKPLQPALGPLQLSIVACVLRATRNAQAVSMLIFLRFILPFVSHPGHVCDRAATSLAVKTICAALKPPPSADEEELDLPTPAVEFVEKMSPRLQKADFYESVATSAAPSLFAIPSALKSHESSLVAEAVEWIIKKKSLNT